MNKRRGGRGFKYSDEFKRRLVAESRAAGVSVPMVANKHGVSSNRIYDWRSDARYQSDASNDARFMAVALHSGDGDEAALTVPEVSPKASGTTISQIEITLENGRKLSVSDRVDAAFVLELARGLAA